MFGAVENGRVMRVVVGTISFRTTAGDIRSGVGDHSAFNHALQQALEEIDRLRKSGSPVSGIAGHWNDYNVQLDIAG